MKIKPRYLIVAGVVTVGLYFAGVPAGTLLFVIALAYMASMHLGGHGGHGGHGATKAPSTEETPTPAPTAPPTAHTHR